MSNDELPTSPYGKSFLAKWCFVRYLWQGVRQHLISRRFWKNSGLLMLANVVVMILGLARVPIVTRVLTKDEVGMLGVVASALPFLQLLSLPGLDGAAYHYVAKGHPKALLTNISTRLRWSILSTLGFLFGGIYWLLRGNSTLAGLFTIAALTYPMTTGLTAVAGFLSAREDFGRLFWYRIAEALTRYGGFTILLLLPSLSGRVLWFSLGGNVALAVLQIYVASWLVLRVRNSKGLFMPPEEEREALRYGRHLTVMSGISTARTQMDTLIVGWFLPLGVVADYSIAQLVHGQLKRLWAIYYYVRYPSFVRLAPYQRRRRMVFEAIAVWIGFIVLGVIAALGLWTFIPIILPPEYNSSLPFIGWFLIAFAAGVPGYFVDMYFRTQQDERNQYRLLGATAVSGIVLPVLCVLLWQARAIVWGRVAASVVFSVLGIILFALDREGE
jgi:O-antigen/teichoic acid export membrane protein